ncbi:class I SAM-dependent methyltransferase [Humibacter albus]|uniref:class I SAM-dependent methyltransferase n=1 Tax=Humibacter albus TaxID=427754 RepID=UPI0004069726|nr:class I SAM-dependent methyltransferase [Humibacter albus]
MTIEREGHEMQAGESDRSAWAQASAPFRDLDAYHERSHGYDSGWLGRVHHEISDRLAALAFASAPDARTVLDVGCGTGYLLRSLAASLPHAERFVGIDPAAGMIEVAERSTEDPRISFTEATAESLDDALRPFGGAPDANTDGFDLIVSGTSFDHWIDQSAGLEACARALRPGGALVLCDQFSWLLLPTLMGTRRGKARTPGRATALLMAAGFTNIRWQHVYTSLIRAAVATAPAA